jgi:hypothetical protein
MTGGRSRGSPFDGVAPQLPEVDDRRSASEARHTRSLAPAFRPGRFRDQAGKHVIRPENGRWKEWKEKLAPIAIAP